MGQDLIRLLKANEIECRISTINARGLSLLLYKDARVDQRILDETFGALTVTEGIGDHYKIETDYENRIKKNTIDRWEPLQPVFISAQTGQGKNYFIENSLLPYVRELNLRKHTNQKILIISNRLALQEQTKAHLGKCSGINDETKEMYTYDKFVDVITYQSLLFRQDYFKNAQKKKSSSSKYIFVICDEAHFFTSDAMFNPHTQRILSAIVDIFRDAIRVYMSATPYECLEYIRKYEFKYNFENKKLCMVFYHFERNYDYLDVKSYSDIHELYAKIVDSVSNRDEKWLIFIDDKRKC